MFPILPQNKIFQEPPRWWGQAIAAAASLAGGLLGQHGASSANSRSSLDNWAMYLNNIDLANSSYQRAARDLEKAGVNPLLLSGGLSGADTPKASSFNYQNETAIPAQALANLGSVVSQTELNSAKADTESSIQSMNDAYAEESYQHASVLANQAQTSALDAELAQAKLDYMQDLKEKDPNEYRSFIEGEISGNSNNYGTKYVGDAIRGANALVGQTARNIRENTKAGYQYGKDLGKKLINMYRSRNDGKSGSGRGR